MRVIVQFSGGKDSHASLIWAANTIGVDKVEAVFCNTHWEDPRTILHIVQVCEMMNVKLTILDSMGMEALATKKNRFPSAKARFCTEELKVKPFIDYLIDEVKDHVVIIQGIRAEESDSRAKMSKECRYFKYYLEPYDRNDWKIARKLVTANKHLALKKQVPQLLQEQIDELELKISKGKLEPKFYTYRKKEVLQWIGKYCDDVQRPVINCSADEVIEIILKAGHNPNVKYKEGALRVGCDPCIHVGLKELYHAIKSNPHRYRVELPSLEEKLGTTFFAPGFIPDRFCTSFIVNKKGEKKWFPKFMDVVNYLDEKNSTVDIFNQDDAIGHKSCFSYYQICE